MSWNPALDPGCPDEIGVDAIETLIIPRARDLGGFEVRRALPAPRRQMVGPFIFFDQMGPAELLTDQGIDVRAHPHIGLGTVTYLYQGHFQHRDSLGTNQVIHPGAVNWMLAGRGVTHSERSTAGVVRYPDMGGLPEEDEDRVPLFEHHGQGTLPMIEAEGIEVRLILGTAYGETAPATMFSETFYLDVTLQPGARFPLPDDHEDRGLYITQGAVSIAGETFETGRMMVFRPSDKITVQAGPQGARLMALGGATLNGPRHVWWNFVCPPARTRSRRPRKTGAPPTGARAPSTCHPMTRPSIFRCRRGNFHEYPK